MGGESFGHDATLPVAWCNLCKAENREFKIRGDGDWLSLMEAHTRLAHPEHQAALDRGEEYVPVEVED